MTTLDDVRASATKGVFPVERLSGCQSAIAFFAAAYMGKQDVIHLVDAGIPDVTAVDKDWTKLCPMQALYDGRIKTRHGDALREALHLIGKGVEVDVVSLDPWSQFIAQTMDALPVYARLAKKLLIAGISTTWLGGEAPNTEGVEKRLAAVLGDRYLDIPSCVEVRKRSDHDQGQFWAVFERVS